jgi:deoxyribodipyrimidine photolyase-like uncharacterized protein
LVLVLGDQLDAKSAAFDAFDLALDAVWMAEVAEESTHVWSHKARIAVFLSAMRHFGETLRRQGVTVHYRQLEAAGNCGTLVGELTAAVSRLCPRKLIVVEPGEFYWHFLLRHEERLAKNQRMVMQLKNLARLTEADRLAIHEHAGQIRHQCLSE